MDHKSFFLDHWKKEEKATRKVISRVPHDKAEHRADPKARTARELAWLIAYEEAGLADGLESGVFNWVEKPAPATIAEVIAYYEKGHDALTKRMEAIPAAKWEEKMPFLWNGQEFMREPGYDMAWGFLKDQIHHRGQLATYLRPMGAKVPAIYGPSADEQT